jgi:hypothetical protein
MTRRAKEMAKEEYEREVVQEKNMTNKTKCKKSKPKIGHRREKSGA